MASPDPPAEKSEDRIVARLGALILQSEDRIKEGIAHDIVLIKQQVDAVTAAQTKAAFEARADKDRAAAREEEVAKEVRKLSTMYEKLREQQNQQSQKLKDMVAEAVMAMPQPQRSAKLGSSPPSSLLPPTALPSSSPLHPEHRDGFRMALPASMDPTTHVSLLVPALEAELSNLMHLPDGSGLKVEIQNLRHLPPRSRKATEAGTAAATDPAAPAGRPTVYFRVRQIDAQAIREFRKQLKGNAQGLVINDWLTPAERAQQIALWPIYRKERDSGNNRRMFWLRSRLFVDGVEVSAPAPSPDTQASA
jgi:hypothetical protein